MRDVNKLIDLLKTNDVKINFKHFFTGIPLEVTCTLQGSNIKIDPLSEKIPVYCITSDKWIDIDRKTIIDYRTIN